MAAVLDRSEYGELNALESKLSQIQPIGSMLDTFCLDYSTAENLWLSRDMCSTFCHDFTLSQDDRCHPLFA